MQLQPGDKRRISGPDDAADRARGGCVPSGAPMGDLVGKTATIVGESQTYNSCFVVDVDGRVYDIHDEYLIMARSDLN